MDAKIANWYHDEIDPNFKGSLIIAPTEDLNDIFAEIGIDFQ